MVYRGSVKNGMVVLEGDPPLKEGAEVRVELIEEPQEEPVPGTSAAIIRALEAGAHFQGDPAEWDRLLAELNQMKRAEVQAQLDEWKRNGERNPLDEA